MDLVLELISGSEVDSKLELDSELQMDCGHVLRWILN